MAAKQGLQMDSFDLACAKVAEALQLMNEAPELVKQDLDNLKENKNHFVNFTGTTFVLATHVEGSFSSTSLSGDMKIFFIANIL